MKKNNQNRGNSSATAAAERTAQVLASSPDFERNICVVLRDRNGNEIFRSAPLFSAVEAERIGDQGADEYFEVGMMPADGVQYPGIKWDSTGFYWSPESSKPKANVRQESGV